MSSLADILREKQAGRKKDNTRVQELAAIRANLARQKRVEEELAVALEKKRVEEEVAAKLAKEAAIAEAERKHKTNDYFDFDRQHRRIAPPGSPCYYGDNVKRVGTWVPHGQGDLLFEGKKVYSGHYEQGVMHGIGTMFFPDGSIWEGEFKMGKMHGIGLYTQPCKENGPAGEREEALMRDNVLHCFKKELQDGMQVEIYDPSMKIGNNASPRVTIQFHNSKWNYRCRFHDEVRPRERNVDFSMLKHFKVLHHLPRVYDLSRFCIRTDHPDQYDYYSDTFRTGIRPPLGVAGGRYTAEMKALHAPLIPLEERTTSKYDENIFESREMGIGLSLMEKEQKKFAEKKRAQWDAAVGAKRAAEDAVKQQHIEEEQARILAEAAEKQEEKQRLKRLADNETAARLAEEAAKWDAAGVNGGMPAPQIRERGKARRGVESGKEASAVLTPARPQLSRKLTTVEITQEMSNRKASVWTLSRSMSQSYLHKKANRTLSRVNSRYKRHKDQDLLDQGFETGDFVIIEAHVQFQSPDGDDDIPLFQQIASFLSVSLDSSGSDTVRSVSVMPVEDEEKRTYQWTQKDLDSILIRVTADTLDLSSAEVHVMEEVKGRKSVSLGTASFNFDAMKKDIGIEVPYVVPLINKNNGEHKGILRMKLKIIDTTVYME